MHIGMLKKVTKKAMLCWSCDNQHSGVINLLHYPIVQVAYFVNDARVAAERAAIEFGAGPFFFVPKIQLAWGIHRGEDVRFLHSSAYGQFGRVMMELVQQDIEGPSPFRDMYAPGEEGIHHMAMMVDSMADAYQAADAAGYEIAAKAATLTGTEFAFIDTVQRRGHMLEIYEKSDQLLGFYKMVGDAAAGWDGRDPVRSLG